MAPLDRIDIAPLRRFVVARQGYASAKQTTRGAAAETVRATIRSLQAVQLDSISTVERAHRLTISSRIGTYEPGTENELLASGQIFEYWAHEACLLDIEQFPMMRRRMEELYDRHWWGRPRGDRGLDDEILATIRDDGPLPARAFSGRNTPGEMWSWKPAKQSLEHLFAAGELVIARRAGFQRVYDLPERVIPKWALEAPVPSEAEFVRQYTARAIDARGALTAAGVVEHCRLKGRQKLVAAALEQLISEGRIRQLQVEDGGVDVFVPAGIEIDGDPRASVLLCPFDNLLWDRKLAPRLFGFEHIIEVYKPAPIREFGYYVLPLLMRDRFVGRVDLRRDRPTGQLQVLTVHRESGVRASKTFDRGLRTALARVAGAAGVALADEN